LRRSGVISASGVGGFIFIVAPPAAGGLSLPHGVVLSNGRDLGWQPRCCASRERASAALI
jgi:hypothetical protein